MTSLTDWMQINGPKINEENMDVDHPLPTQDDVPKADFDTLISTLKSASTENHWKQYGCLLGSISKLMIELENVSQSYSKVKKICQKKKKKKKKIKKNFKKKKKKKKKNKRHNLQKHRQRQI